MHVPFPVEHASNEGRRRESSNDFVLEEACRDRCAQANSSREPAALRNTSDGSRVLVREDKKIRRVATPASGDRKSTRLNSSHGYISYAVFCLKKKKKHIRCKRAVIRRLLRN